MACRLVCSLLTALLVLGASDPAAAGRAPVPGAGSIAFEPNLGQSGDEVAFLARGPGYGLFLSASEAVLALARAEGAPGCARRGALGCAALASSRRAAAEVVRLRWLGAAAEPRMRGVGRLPGSVGYFRGSDPAAWRSEVPLYRQVVYEGLYPGIDLVFYGTPEGLEYDFIVAPGADPGRIRLAIEGAGELALDRRGDLVLRLPGGDLRQPAPRLYQPSEDGGRRPVEGSFALVGAAEIAFRPGPYDAGRSLVIDPKLLYSTYLGGDDNEQLASIALDNANNLYLATYSLSADFPVGDSPSQFQGGDSDLVIAKLDRNGGLVRAVYLGGNEQEGLAPLVRVHPAWPLPGSGGTAEALLVAGHTFSKNFPTTPGAMDRDLDCSQPFDPFPGEVCVDDLCCPGDLFLTVFDRELRQILYSSFLGGESTEAIGELTLDDDGRIYLVGTTSSKSFPMVRPTQGKRAGALDAWVAILEPPGGPGSLLFSSYLGGKGGRRVFEEGVGIGLDPAGYLQVAGATGSRKFPTVDPLQGKRAGKVDLFLAVYDLGDLTPAAGAARRTRAPAAGDPTLVFSTYLGGKKTDRIEDMAVDGKGRTYLVGWTDSADFPTVEPFQGELSGTTDAWLSVLDWGHVEDGPPLTPELLFSTYFGGSNSDIAWAVAVDRRGRIHLGGWTFSDDLPLRSAIQKSCARERPGTSPRCQDSFLARFDKVVPGRTSQLRFSTYLGGPGVDNGDGTQTPGTEFGIQDLVVDRAGHTYVVGETFSKEFPLENATQPEKSGGFDLFIAKISR